MDRHKGAQHYNKWSKFFVYVVCNGFPMKLLLRLYWSIYIQIPDYLHFYNSLPCSATIVMLYYNRRCSEMQNNKYDDCARHYVMWNDGILCTELQNGILDIFNIWSKSSVERSFFLLRNWKTTFIISGQGGLNFVY